MGEDTKLFDGDSIHGKATYRSFDCLKCLIKNVRIMKKFFVLVAAIVLMVGFSSKLMAQATPLDVTARASLADAIQMTKTGDLNFGNILNDADGGNVVLSTAGTATYNSGISALTTEVGVPTFNVTTAYQNMSYLIKITNLDELVRVGSGGTPGDTDKMTISDIVVNVDNQGEVSYSSSGINSTLGATTSSSFKIGATVTVKQDQVAGLYTKTFNVQVTYN